MTEQEEIIKLKKEIASLHGKLGVQGMKISKDIKISSLKESLSEAYLEIERHDAERRLLRDDIAMRAMQGLLACSKIHDIPMEDFNDAMAATASVSYGMADIMLKERDKE